MSFLQNLCVSIQVHKLLLHATRSGNGDLKGLEIIIAQRSA